MIKAEQIYQATDDGLDIIISLYPDAKECIQKYCTTGTPKKHFAIRNEKTPSCSLKKFKDCWRVTDFGGDGSAESPIDLYMRERSASTAFLMPSCDWLPNTTLAMNSKKRSTSLRSQSVMPPSTRKMVPDLSS